MIQIYDALDRGNTAPMIALMSRWYEDDDAISLRLMSTVMDVASGITADRRAMIEAEAETALLKTYLNFTLHLFDVLPELDLGDPFRQRPRSDIPLLVLSGTLDGRTYIESQLEATSGFTNRQAVTLQNAGHNLFMASPAVTETIQDFMRGQDVDGRLIVLDPPSLAAP
jgi:pimeloyl-ACP methyl ester carboxylesterase